MDNQFYEEQLQRARGYLLTFYSSECVAHGAYILTIVIGTFAFVETIPKIHFPIEILKVPLISLGFTILERAGFFMLMRILLWSRYTTCVTWVKPVSPKEAAKVHVIALQKERANITLLYRLELAAKQQISEEHTVVWLFSQYNLRTLTALIPVLALFFVVTYMLLGFVIVF